MIDGQKVVHKRTSTTGPSGVVLGTTHLGMARILWWDGEESEEDPDDLLPATTFLEGMHNQDHLREDLSGR